MVQDLCATAALTALGDEDAYDELLPPLLSARNPRTRSAGVTALRRAGRSERAEPFLIDRSALVRACARYVVRRQGDDPAAWYRERCTASDARELPPGAVIGLAECGNRADAGLLRPLLVHSAAGVRARAVAGLRALDCADVDQLRPLLDDPAAGVVRETVAALLPFVKELPADRLLESTGSERPRHVRVGAFRLLDHDAARGGRGLLRPGTDLRLPSRADFVCEADGTRERALHRLVEFLADRDHRRNASYSPLSLAVTSPVLDVSGEVGDMTVGAELLAHVRPPQHALDHHPRPGTGPSARCHGPVDVRQPPPPRRHPAGDTRLRGLRLRCDHPRGVRRGSGSPPLLTAPRHPSPAMTTTSSPSNQRRRSALGGLMRSPYPGARRASAWLR